MEFLSSIAFESFIDYVQLGFKLAQETSSMTETESFFVQTLFTGTLEETLNAAYSLPNYISLQTIVQLKSQFKLNNPSGKIGTLHVHISKNWSKMQRARKRVCIMCLKNRPRVIRKIECQLADPRHNELQHDPNEMYALALAKCDTAVIV